MREMLRRGIVVATIVLIAPMVRAQTLDQQITPPGGFWHNVNAGYDWAQTFTSGLGGQLTRVEVQVAKEATTTRLPLIVEIRRTTAAGSPVEDNGNVLGRVSLDPSLFLTLPDHLQNQGSIWVAADLTSSDIRVRPGDVLGIVLRSDEPNDPFERGYVWKSYPQGQDEYPGGDAFKREPGQTFLRMTGGFATDSSLRSYVLVPEPGAAAMLAAACGPLLARRRGRKAVILPGLLSGAVAAR
jgi:hypothetical protein